MRAGKVVRGLGALVLLAALIGGVPYALCHFVGWPLPRRLPSWSGLDHALSQHGIPDQTLVDALAVAVWLCWAVLVLALVAEVPAALRGDRARRLPIAGAFQPLTGHLVAALIVAMLALSPRPAQARGAPMPGTLPVATAVLTDVPVSGRAAPAGTIPIWETTILTDAGAAGDVGPAARKVSPSATEARNVERTYVVRRGDTLWGIAARELGDPLRWSEIYRLNAGRPEPGGQVLSDPHWIDPGWTLLLPPSSVARGSGGSPPPNPAAPVSRPAPTTAPPTTAPPARTEPTATTTPPVPTSTLPSTTVPSPRQTAPSSTTLAPTPAPGAPHDRGRDAGAAPVRLPSGSIVGGSFALGILGALALARLRRRHAYRYRPPEPGRRLGPDPLRPTLRALATAVQRVASGDEMDEDEGPPERVPLVVASAMADEDPDHRERPDRIEVGVRGDETVALALSELAGAVIDGPDPDGVLRAWVTALLVRAGPLAAELWTTEAAIDRLVPGAARLLATGEVPGIRVFAGTAGVLRLVQAEATMRARQLAADDTPDVLTYRRANPWEPVPSVVALVEGLPAAEVGRWRGCCADGARLGLGAFVLDGDDAGVRVSLDADCAVTAAHPDTIASTLVGVHCFTLGAEEALDVLATLVEVDARPTSDEEADPQAEDEAWPEPADGAAEARSAFLGQPEGASEEPAGADREEQGGEGAPVVVSCFGPYAIAAGGAVVAKGLRATGRELLAWYLCRPEGASIEAAVEACWPDTEPGQVHRTYWRAASSLRTKVGAVAEPPTKLLTDAGSVYRLDAGAIDCDLWRFETALGAAAHATDDEAACVALLQAVDCYRGEFLDGEEYRWVEPVREDLHRRALDAHLRLAELEEARGALDAAEEALRGAIGMDRYAEEPYRRLMTLQATRDRLDAVGATWRSLERALAEIDVDPEPTTLRLYRSLTTPPDARARGSRPIRLSS